MSDRVMPLLGLGVWQVPDGPACVKAVRAALELGYRHIDTAQAYGNEASVGRALRESGIARDELFITTKFQPDRRDPLRESARSIDQLGVDYVDLYLVHWPQGGALWAWPEMEHACERSYTRSIGVSNFSAVELGEVMTMASTPPVVDQIQFNPFAYREGLARTRATRRRARGVQPARHRRPPGGPDGRRDRAAPGAHAGTSAAALVRPARRPRGEQVDAPRSNRGERTQLRLRDLASGHGPAGRARPHRGGRTPHSSGSGGRAEVGEQRPHRALVGEHQRGEAGDVLLTGAIGEPVDQGIAGSAALPGLEYGDGDLGDLAVLPVPDVAGDADAAALGIDCHDASWSWWSTSVR